MIIAVTYENGEVFGHFGHTKQFKLYTIENNVILESKIVNTNGNGHGALSQFLSDLGVNALICGGIGMGARIAINDAKIDLFPGVTGNADDAINNYLIGKLNFNPNATCSHHHDNEHNCASHSCGDNCKEEKNGCNGNH